MSKEHTCFRVIRAVCLVFVIAAPVAAQTFYLEQPPEERTFVGVRALNPNFDPTYESGFSTLTATYDLYVSLYIGDRMSLHAELPFTHVGLADTYEGDQNQNGIGNVYVGVQRWSAPRKSSRLVYSLGIRPPTGDDNSPYVPDIGYLSDLYHIGRAIPNTWTIEGNSAYHRIPTAERDYLFGVEFGPTALFPTVVGDPELLFHYGGVFGSRINHLIVSAELSGLFLVSEDVPDFGDRFDHQLALGITLIDFPVKPQLFYEFPLDKGVRNVVDGVLGLRLEYGFSRPSSEWD